MEDWCARFGRIARALGGGAALVMLGGLLARVPEEAAGGEANLKLPDLSTFRFLVDGHTLLLYGIVSAYLG